MGIQDTFYPRMFNLAEQAAQQLTEAHLRAAAATLEEADTWVQLDQNLKYALINVAQGAAATVMRLDLRYSDSYTTDLHCQLEHGV